MSRSHRDLDNSEKARTIALQRMLRLRDAGAVKDGTDTVREAFDDTQFIRDLAKQLHADMDGEGDDAELGLAVRARVIAYCESCPKFEDYVSQALADLSEHDTEQQDRDDRFEREDALTHS